MVTMSLSILTILTFLLVAFYWSQKASADTKTTNDSGNFTIGPSKIHTGLYGQTKDQARDVGLTEGGVSYNYSRTKYESTSDQTLGPLRAKTTADRLEISFTMKENTLENLALAWDLPASAIDEDDNSIVFGGGEDEIHRSLWIDGPAPGGGQANWEFWKLDSFSSNEIGQTKDGDALLQVTMLCLEDVTKPKGQRYGKRTDVYDDTTAPEVNSINPDDEAVDVDVDSRVEWTFSEAIQEIDITPGNFNVLDESGDEVAGELSYDRGTNKVIFTPDANLSNSTTYFTFASSEVRDLAGNTMGNNHRANFTTIA